MPSIKLTPSRKYADLFKPVDSTGLPLGLAPHPTETEKTGQEGMAGLDGEHDLSGRLVYAHASINWSLVGLC
jgi:hypothetical protein